MDDNSSSTEQTQSSLESLLNALLRKDSENIQTFLQKVVCDVSITNTRTKAHCYFVSLDGNRRPRVNDFARFIANRIVNFAIPRDEITRAQQNDIQSNSTAAMSNLYNKAKKLFTKLPKSGEGGEVLLSLLAEGFLNIPQLFTKMVLKTNETMHVHGCDGIHGSVNEKGKLALYWGESKLHKDVNSAVKSCFESIAPFLLDSGGSGATQERDLQLMRDGLSLNDPKLVEALKRFLDPEDPMFNKMEYRGICLVGFDSTSYPISPNSLEADTLRQKFEETFNESKKTIEKKVAETQLQSFTLELFCLPFPDVQQFRDAFRKELGLHDE